MKFEIKHRYNGSVLFECDVASWKVAVELAITKNANLRYANLRSANLSYADLRSANLSSANLSSANLRYADLRSADLSSADLSSANLSSADLSSANLSSADLRSANLSSADLRSANLRSANLRYADLRSADLSSANLTDIKKDFFERLTLAKGEAKGLYDYLMKGKINGSSYEGECACFCGTIANIRQEKYSEMKIDLRPDSDSPTERFFLAIRKGDIPQSNPVSDVVRTWIEEFAKENAIGLPRYEIVAIEETK